MCGVERETKLGPNARSAVVAPGFGIGIRLVNVSPQNQNILHAPGFWHATAASVTALTKLLYFPFSFCLASSLRINCEPSLL